MPPLGSLCIPWRATATVTVSAGAATVLCAELSRESRTFNILLLPRKFGSKMVHIPYHHGDVPSSNVINCTVVGIVLVDRAKLNRHTPKTKKLSVYQRHPQIINNAQKACLTSRFQQLDLLHEQRVCLGKPWGNSTLVGERMAKIHQFKLDDQLKVGERQGWGIFTYKIVPKSIVVSVSTGISFPFSSRALSS